MKLFYCIFILLLLAPFSLTLKYQREDRANVQINVTEFEEFVDAFMNEQMTISQVPGLVFSMVNNGEIFFMKGYGLSNLETNTSVDPNTTIFGVASISKTFTATGIMKLYESKELDVFDFPNTYLDVNNQESTEKMFTLPSSPFLQPLTIANLLTHSGGVDERWIETSAENEDQMLSIGNFLNKVWPPFVRPPNETSTYSNIGFVLNGYIIQTITQIEFSSYIKEQITRPLTMWKSDFAFPINTTELTNYAMGYAYDFVKNQYSEIPNWYYFTPMPAPSATMKTTGRDMAKYMLMHLGNGTYDGITILEPETIKTMHSQHYTMDPQLPGYCYCFYEYYRNGIRAIMHEGDIDGFASLLFLLPDYDIGFFMSMNRMLEPGAIPLMDDPSHNALRQLFTEQFLDRYFPPVQNKNTTTPVPWSGYSFSKMSRYTGYFAPIRSPHKTFVRILRGQYQITSWGDDNIGGISIGGYNYVEVNPMHFQQVNDENWLYPQITFRENDKGEVYMMIFDNEAYERIPVYGRDQFTYSAIGIFTSFFGLFILITIAFSIKTRCRSRGLDMINVQDYYRLLLKHEPVQVKPSGALRTIVFLAKLFGCLACMFQGSFLMTMYFYLFRSSLWAYTVNAGTITFLLLPSFGISFTILMTIFGMFFVCLIRRKELYDQISRVEVFAYFFVNALLIIEIPWLVYWNFVGLKY